MQQEDDTRMKHEPSLGSIEERLSRTLEQFAALPSGEQISGVPTTSWQLERAVKKLIEKKNEWLPAVPNLHDVQNWVEVHWDTERQTEPPTGTVSIGDEWVYNGEVQLDTLAAACKLLLAAAGHGAETVAKYSMEFAAHGMIEVRSFYLLKGASVSSAKPLDDYCTLLPYREALQKVDTQLSLQPWALDSHWPPEQTTNVCALETRSFERRGLAANEFERRVSHLLQCGLETLALIFGLVWGKGFRMFGSCHSVIEPVAATLPFFHSNSSTGRGTLQIELPILHSPSNSTPRPLNNTELIDLIDKYSVLPEETHRVLSLALRRLRECTERMNIEDKIIDLSIVLEALFSKGSEAIRETVASRGSWYFSDSSKERIQTYKLLQKFYDERSHIIHGNVSRTLAREQRREQTRQDILADIENVVRASIKTMISEGRPQDWEESKDPKAIRYDPPRAATEIPSMKSDSLSWTVAEQKEIDQALQAVWKPEVDRAPAPPPDAAPVVHQGVNAEEIERCEQQGIPYVVSVPIRLYMAHPRWPNQEGDPVDQRTKYYCRKDVERHLRRWQKAASEKKMYRFDLPLEDPTMYLPAAFDKWGEILQRGGITMTGQAP